MANPKIEELIASLGSLSAEDKAKLGAVLGVQAPTGTFAWTWASASKWAVDPETGKQTKGEDLGQYPKLVGPGLSTGRGAIKHKIGDIFTVITSGKALVEQVAAGKFPADAALKPGETRATLVERAKAILAKHYSK